MAADKEHIVPLNDDNFKDGISTGVTLVDFYADWCGPCRMMAPILEKVAQELESKAKFAKVDTDKAEKTAGKYGITSIPTLILFKNGEEVNRVVGLKDATALKALVQSAL
ncbi:MAG: thioredoxin [Parachlamydiales bacterium]|nr:thioredoxin [Parachlamydiales bacterium]